MWIVTEVVTEPSVARRVKVIKQFIKVKIFLKRCY
jgi:hypothetical protein